MVHTHAYDCDAGIELKRRVCPFFLNSIQVWECNAIRIPLCDVQESLYAILLEKRKLVNCHELSTILCSATRSIFLWSKIVDLVKAGPGFNPGCNTR